MNNLVFIIEGAEGKSIAADLTYKDSHEESPLILFVHGFKGFKDWGTHRLLSAYFAENGLRFFKFNLSHNGTTAEQPQDFADLEAFGDNTFSKELFDLTQVISFACSGMKFPATEQVYLLGHSRGGGISIIQTAGDERIKKLVTWASVSRFNHLWHEEQEAQWRQAGVIYSFNSRTKQNMPLKSTLLTDLERHAQKLNILSAAAKINCPFLICHGDADKGVGIEQAYDLKDQNKAAELFVSKGGDHVFGASHPYNKDTLPNQLKEVADKSIAFLNEE